MKQLTCAQMGGPCEAMIGGNTWDEMTANGMEHLKQAHPDMVEKMKTMPKEDMDKWAVETKAKWEAAPTM
jgi:predicted small metal-binding protein